MQQRSHENGPLGETRPLGEVTAGPGSDGLNAALGRCADGDRQGLDELRAWEGGRLQAMVLRMLGDPALAEQVLEAALADIYRNAGMLVAVGQGPSDDRVFALVRRHAYAALRTREHRSPVPPPVPLRPTLAPAAQAQVPAPREAEAVVAAPVAMDAPVAVASPLADEAAEEPAPPTPVALGVATRLEAPRVRRPGLRDETEDSEDEVRDEEYTGGRRWVLAALAWTTAALLGFGVAVLVAGRLGVEVPEPTAAPPAAVEAPPTPSGVDPAPTGAPRSMDPPPSAPGPSPRDLLGEPLQSPEPAALSSPSPRPAPTPPPVVQAPTAAPAAAARPPPSLTRLADVPARPVQPVRAVPPRTSGPAPAVPDSARLFIHHSATDPTAAARARELAQRLQQRGASVVIVRPVPFGIRGLSVRYFHTTDRPGATAVLGDAAALGGGGRAGTARPADFTGFQPAPRPGTIEIWLPGGA